MSYVRNQRARYDFEIIDTLEAGMLLLGNEVKSIRAGRASLAGAFVQMREGDAWLVGATVQPYQPANTPKGYNPERPRQLLFSKKELARLTRETEQNRLTAVPLSLYSKNGKIKLEVAIARGKKKQDKRESIKARDVKRDIDRTLKQQ